MFISNCHKSINNVVIEVFPLTSYGLYGFHMKQSVRTRFKNNKVITIFDHASKVYRTLDFDNQINKLRKILKKGILIPS